MGLNKYQEKKYANANTLNSPLNRLQLKQTVGNLVQFHLL